MTAKEEQALKSMYNLINTLREENSKFRIDVTEQINTINAKVDKEYKPISLENNIVEVIKSTLDKSMQAALTGYGSGLISLINEVVNEHKSELKTLMTTGFIEAIEDKKFNEIIKNSIASKLYRGLLSSNASLFDSITNDLKKDSVFRAKITLAISEAISEYTSK